MLTLKPQFGKFAIEQLKLKLVDKIGFLISSKPDCAKLSELISQSGKGYISETTLYRIFFQPHKHQPYKNTWNIICQFLGFNDCYEFLNAIQSQKESLNYNGIFISSNRYNSLIFFCIENASFKPLNDFFDSISETTDDFKTLVSISLFDALNQSSGQNEFISKFAQHKFVREYFFEKAHDPKFRLKNFDFAYESYLKGVNAYRSITDFQDYIFGNAVIFRYYFLTNQIGKALDLGSKMYSQFNSLECYQKDLFIFPFIRFTAYKLWYLQISGASSNDVLDYVHYLLDLCKKTKPHLATFSEQKILFHTLAETFLYAHLPETFHWELKKIYVLEFKRFPELIYSKHLKYSLPYFEENGLLHHRP